MTQTQATQYEKALTRAAADGCQIAGKGTVKATGATVYAVTCSKGDHCYCVTVHDQHLTCTCKAGTNGQYCKHRAVVRARIVASATPSGALAELGEYRAEMTSVEPADDRDAAMDAANARRDAAILVPNTARRSRFL